MPAPKRFEGTFSDSDEFCATAVGMDIEFCQLDRGKLSASLELAIGQNFIVQHFDISRRFHQHGAVPHGLLTFGLPDYVDKMTWSGRAMERDSVLNFSRRNGFDAVSAEEFSGYTFSITADSFERAISSLDESMPAEAIHDMADHFAARESDIRTIRSLASGLLHCLKSGVAGITAYRELESDLSHVLARSVCNSAVVDLKSSYARRQQAVNKALEFIQSTQDAITVSEVYKQSCISWRTLDRAFKERFGVTPKQYIVATRLIGVRRALLTAPSEATVTDVASDWGFWHLGRFSSDYKHMFGELPSQTLRRQRD